MIVVVAAFAVASQQHAKKEAQRAVAAKLVSQSRAMLGGTRDGGDRRAIQQMVAAEALEPGSDPEALMNTVIDTRQLMRVITVPTNVTNVDVSPDGRQILSSGDDGLIRRWDLKSGEPEGDPLAGQNGKAGAAYVRDGRWIASAASADWTVRVWDANTGATVHVLPGPHDDVTTGEISPDGTIFATGNRDGTIVLRDVETGKQIGEPIHGHDAWVLAMAFSPDGTRLLTGGRDGAMQLWNVSTHQPADPPLPSHRGPVVGVEFSPDGRRIASMSYLVGSEGNNASDATQLRVTDSYSGRPIVDGITESGYGGYSLAFRPDGRRVAIGGSDKKIHVFDADTGASVGLPLSGHTGPVNSLTYSGDGTRIFSAGDHTIHVWSAEPDQAIATPLPGLAFDGSLPAAVSPDGSVVATRDVNNESDIALWGIDTGRHLRTISTGHRGPVTALAWEPDGQAIASAASADNTVRLWDTQTGEPRGPALTGPTTTISRLLLSQDGRHVAALVFDSGADPWLWDTSASPPRGTALRGDGEIVTTASFSADGRRLITVAQTHFAIRR